MATAYFDDILMKGLMKGQVPNKSKEARNWYRNAAKDVAQVNNGKLFKKAALTNNVEPGSMYMFSYDPKHKDTLPYYDMFPLIFPLGPAPGGFLGLNMHYLPLPLRARLMDALYTTINNKDFNDTTKLMINYNTLSKAKSMKLFKPCIKHYLTGHVRSRFILVAPEEWDVALFLPTAKWGKGDQAQVWNDSKRMVRA